VIFLEGFDTPMLIRKRDGAFLYATTDLATIQYRMEQWKPDAILYVVDHRQSLHFEQLFATARRWGYEDVELKHIGFGTVLGEDGRPIKTRSGWSVDLSDVINEVVAHAAKVVAEADTEGELSPEQRAEVAEVVGVGAIKYFDLSHNRTSDYRFSYEAMLNLRGNTATYMQYAFARCRSILRKAGVDPDTLRASGAKIVLTDPAERALALELARFAEAVAEVPLDYRPNLLTSYLFDQVAKSFSTFFENCPVLKAPSDEVRASRCLLVDLTSKVLKKGLELLGIDVVERL
jgi:arginyl-tRNA synthetase